MSLLLLLAIPISLYAILQSRGVEFLPYSRTVLEGGTEEVAGKQLIASTFGHPNYMAAYLSPLVFWSLYFILVNRRGWQRWVGVVSGVAILAALIVGGTRGPWLAVVAAAFPFYLIVALVPEYRRPLLFSGGVAILLALIIVFVPNPLVRVQFNLAERVAGNKEIVARFYYWLMAVEMIKQNPLVGVGHGNFNLLFWDYVYQYQSRPDSVYFRYVLTESIRGTHPGFVHNDHLQLLTEGGILTFVPWAALWSAIFTRSIGQVRTWWGQREPLLLTATLFSSLLSFGVDGLFNFPIHVPVSGFLFWVLVGAWTVHGERAIQEK